VGRESRSVIEPLRFTLENLRATGRYTIVTIEPDGEAFDDIVVIDTDTVAIDATLKLRARKSTPPFVGCVKVWPEPPACWMGARNTHVTRLSYGAFLSAWLAELWRGTPLESGQIIRHL
jgi:hypothetical protein